MPVHLVALVIGAAAPDGLARFWGRALGWRVGGTEGGAVDLVPTDGVTSFRLRFQPGAPEKLGQNRIHFDLTTRSADDQDATVTELVEAGAAHIDIGQTPADGHVVLADPEGNELCIIEPSNRFLAPCPRLGAVNCDGTAELGYFFRDALAWPLVWDRDEETAIQAPDGTGPKVTWSGPPLMPRPDRERFHHQLAPAPGTSVEEALDHLLTLGATRLEGNHACPGAIGLADVDGNELCLVERRLP